MRTLRRRDGGERGYVLIHTAVGLAAFMSASMLAVDVGMFMVARTQAQSAADAGALAAATALVFDDFHLVDESADIRHIVRELLTRAPERMTFAFASRREPPIRLARLLGLEDEILALGDGSAHVLCWLLRYERVAA